MTDEDKKVRRMIWGLEACGAGAALIGGILGELSARSTWRRRAVRAVESIGGYEAFNDLAPKVAQAKIKEGYTWIPSLIHIRKEWWEKKLKIKKLSLEDFRDIVGTCEFLREAKKAAVAREIFKQEEGE